MFADAFTGFVPWSLNFFTCHMDIRATTAFLIQSLVLLPQISTNVGSPTWTIARTRTSATTLWGIILALAPRTWLATVIRQEKAARTRLWPLVMSFLILCQSNTLLIFFRVIQQEGKPHIYYITSYIYYTALLWHEFSNVVVWRCMCPDYT
jgi:hypothetical protein